MGVAKSYGDVKRGGRAPPSCSIESSTSSQEVRPLTAAEEARCEENKHFVMERMPEFVPFIRDMVKADLITGWRDVSTSVIKGEK